MKLSQAPHAAVDEVRQREGIAFAVIDRRAGADVRVVRRVHGPVCAAELHARDPEGIEFLRKLRLAFIREGGDIARIVAAEIRRCAVAGQAVREDAGALHGDADGAAQRVGDAQLAALFQIDVAGRALHGVARDGRAAGDVHASIAAAVGRGKVDAAAPIARRVAADHAAAHGKAAAIDVDAAAPTEQIRHHGVSVYGLVAADRAAAHGEAAALDVDAAAEGLHRAEAGLAHVVADDAAAREGEAAALDADAAAVLIRPAAGEDAAGNGDALAREGILIAYGALVRCRGIAVDHGQAAAVDLDDAAVPGVDLRHAAIHDMAVQIQRRANAGGNDEGVRKVGIIGADVRRQEDRPARQKRFFKLRPGGNRRGDEGRDAHLLRGHQQGIAAVRFGQRAGAGLEAVQGLCAGVAKRKLQGLARGGVDRIAAQQTRNAAREAGDGSAEIDGIAALEAEAHSRAGRDGVGQLAAVSLRPGAAAARLLIACGIVGIHGDEIAGAEADGVAAVGEIQTVGQAALRAVVAPAPEGGGGFARPDASGEDAAGDDGLEGSRVADHAAAVGTGAGAGNGNVDQAVVNDGFPASDGADQTRAVHLAEDGPGDAQVAELRGVDAVEGGDEVLRRVLQVQGQGMAVAVVAAGEGIIGAAKHDADGEVRRLLEACAAELRAAEDDLREGVPVVGGADQIVALGVRRERREGRSCIGLKLRIRAGEYPDVRVEAAQIRQRRRAGHLGGGQTLDVLGIRAVDRAGDRIAQGLVVIAVRDRAAVIFANHAAGDGSINRADVIAARHGAGLQIAHHAAGIDAADRAGVITARHGAAAHKARNAACFAAFGDRAGIIAARHGAVFHITHYAAGLVSADRAGVIAVRHSAGFHITHYAAGDDIHVDCDAAGAVLYRAAVQAACHAAHRTDVFAVCINAARDVQVLHRAAFHKAEEALIVRGVVLHRQRDAVSLPVEAAAVAVSRNADGRPRAQARGVYVRRQLGAEAGLGAALIVPRAVDHGGKEQQLVEVREQIGVLRRAGAGKRGAGAAVGIADRDRFNASVAGGPVDGKGQRFGLARPDAVGIGLDVSRDRVGAVPAAEAEGDARDRIAGRGRDGEIVAAVASHRRTGVVVFGRVVVVRALVERDRDLLVQLDGCDRLSVFIVLRGKVDACRLRRAQRRPGRLLQPRPAGLPRQRVHRQQAQTEGKRQKKGYDFSYTFHLLFLLF